MVCDFLIRLLTCNHMVDLLETEAGSWPSGRSSGTCGQLSHSSCTITGSILGQRRWTCILFSSVLFHRRMRPRICQGLSGTAHEWNRLSVGTCLPILHSIDLYQQPFHSNDKPVFHVFLFCGYLNVSSVVYK